MLHDSSVRPEPLRLFNSVLLPSSVANCKKSLNPRCNDSQGCNDTPLLPYPTASKENAEKAKTIHFRVASGKPVRVLTFQGVIYAKCVQQSLLAVGQLRDAPGLHFFTLFGRTSILFFGTPALKTERESYWRRALSNAIYPDHRRANGHVAGSLKPCH